VATLSEWRDDLLSAGKAGLKVKPVDEPQGRTRGPKTLIGELTIDNECLKALRRKHEERDPLALWNLGGRSRDRRARGLVNLDFGVRRTMRLL
jgi:hypothetical protein